MLTTVPLWHLFLRVSYSVSIHSGNGFPFLHCSLVPPEGYSLLWSLSLTFTLMYEQLWSPMLLDNGILQTVSLSLSLFRLFVLLLFLHCSPFARKCATSTVLCTVCIYYLCQQPFWAATHSLLLSIVSLTHCSSLVVVVLRIARSLTVHCCAEDTMHTVSLCFRFPCLLSLNVSLTDWDFYEFS